MPPNQHGGCPVQELLIGLAPFLRIIQMLICAALISVVVLQARSGGMGSVFGGDSSLHRTRRGLERTLYQATITLAALFLLFALLNVLATPTGL
jgi:preprotein translocase subunit SecG